MKKIVISILVIAVISLLGYELLRKDKFGVVIPEIVALYEDNLQAKVTATATTMTLVSGTDLQSNSLSGTYGFIIDEGSTDQEFVICSASGTSLSSCKRGIDVTTGQAEISSLQKEHRRGSSVKITNFPILGIMREMLNGSASLPNVLYYDTGIGADNTASSSALMVKSYIDNIVLQGASTSTESLGGIVRLGTQTETASGTWNGANDPTVVQTQYVTSTPSALRGLYIPMAENDGYLSQSWFDLTETWSFSGITTFSGLTNLTATTTAKKIISDNFGGTGSDGALSITAAATTTLDVLGQSVFTKNYSSINIPDTAGLTVTNVSTSGTLLVLKSQGDCTIGGSIYLVGKGSTTSTDGFGILDGFQHFGGTGSKASGNTGGTIGSESFSYATSTTRMYSTYQTGNISRKQYIVAVGSAGGDGGHNDNVSSVGGAGGAGGGGLIIECGGTLTFTGTINTSGANGSPSVGTSGGYGTGGGGGGGSAGMALIIYNYLNSNTGQVIALGGNGGLSLQSAASGVGSTGGGGAGGAGGSCLMSYPGTAYAGGNANVAGTAGGNAIGACGAGGASGAGDQAALGAAGGTNNGVTDAEYYKFAENNWF